MYPLQEPVQGLTLLQDSALPVHWASAGQQDHDCLHGVVPTPAEPSAPPSAGKLRQGEGKQTEGLGTQASLKSQFPTPDKATHLPPYPKLLTQQHKEDPKTDPRTPKDIVGALMRAQGYQDVGVLYPKHPVLALSPVTVTVLQATLPPAGTSSGG